MREQRISRILNIIEDADVDACIVRGMENIFYLTGFRGSEGTLLATRTDLFLLTDFRYLTYARDVTRGVQVVEVRPLRQTLSDLCKKLGIKKIGFDSCHVTFNLYQTLKEGLQDLLFVPIANRIEEIRQSKEPEEVESIRNSIRIATEAFREVFDRITPGMTEKEIANDLDFTMRKFGADCPAFETIVASGPRAALPHASPTDRPIREGETVIIDFGAQVNGYCSDETCTIRVGAISDTMEKVFATVNNARIFALEHVRTGLSIQELDGMVRKFIQDAGYGDFFRHGLGHGVGIAVHEAPAINSSAEGLFQENMVVTIEPGVYLPDVGGVRLEDMVLLSDGKPQVLTSIKKENLMIG